MAPDQARPNTRSATMSPAARARTRARAAQGAASLATTESGRRLYSAQERPRFERHTQSVHAVVASDVEELGHYRGMKMVVLMRIDMVEAKPGGAKGFELRANLGPQLATHSGPNHDRETVGGKVGAKTTRGVDEIADILRRRDGPPLDQDEMQSDAQARHEFAPAPRRPPRPGRRPSGWPR